MEQIKQAVLDSDTEEEQIHLEEACMKRIERMRFAAKNIYTDPDLLQSFLEGLDASHENCTKHILFLRGVQQDKAAQRIHRENLLQQIEQESGTML